MTKTQDTQRKAEKILLALLVLLCGALFLTGCEDSVTGTYRAHGQVNNLTLESGNVMSEFTLHGDGSVTARTDSIINDTLNGRYSYRAESYQITLSLGGEQISGTIANGEVSFAVPHGYRAVFSKGFDFIPVLIPILIVWLIVAVIQGFLAYGLAARNARRKGADGLSLYVDLWLYEMAALIPGLVFYLWHQAKQDDRYREKHRRG